MEFSDLDKILEYHKVNHQDTPANVKAELFPTVSNEEVSIAYEYLRDKGLLAQRNRHKDAPTINCTFGLTLDGLWFVDKGGYNTELWEIAQKREYEMNRRTLELEHIQSTINTNKSVSDTNFIQKVILIITAVLAASSLFVSVLDYFKDDAPKVNVTPAPVRVVLQQQAPDTNSQQRSTRVHQSAANP